MGSVVKDIGHIAGSVVKDLGGAAGAVLSPVGALGAGLLGHLKGLAPPTAGKQADQLTGESQQNLQMANQLLSAAQSGKLAAPQQALVNQYKQEENAKWNQYLAQAGLGQSSSAVQASALVDQQSLALAQQFLQQDFQQGLALLGTSDQETMASAAMILQNDQLLGGALNASFQAIGRIRGSSGSGG